MNLVVFTNTEKFEDWSLTKNKKLCQREAMFMILGNGFSYNEKKDDRRTSHSHSFST